jgi:hypothetical protein
MDAAGTPETTYTDLLMGAHLICKSGRRYRKAATPDRKETGGWQMPSQMTDPDSAYVAQVEATLRMAVAVVDNVLPWDITLGEADRTAMRTTALELAFIRLTTPTEAPWWTGGSCATSATPNRRKAMDADSANPDTMRPGDISRLDDFQLIDERRRITETITALTDRYVQLNQEMTRRETLRWMVP